MKNYQKENIKAIESWIDEGWVWGRPFDHDQCERIRKGEWPFFLTPIKPMPRDWLGEIKDMKVFGLASGGGQQMAILSLLGANCVLLDYSKKQIASDLLVAQREGFSLKTLQADFTKPFKVDSNSFDAVVNPVSLVYAEKIEPIFKEVFRILKKGGTFVAGFDNGLNFISDDEKVISNRFPVNPLSDLETEKKFLLRNDGYEFSHTSGEILKGLLNVGFRIVDCYEDYNDKGPLADLRIPTFIAIKAVKD